jgi:hypothetical protein
MVEIIGGDDDCALSCYSLDLKQLSKSLIYASNVEELCGRKREPRTESAAGAEQPVETRRRL